MVKQKNYDFLIIGAGIIGLSIARAISQRKLGSVLLLEKEPRLGVHSSGRNSGVLHAGIYYAQDSLKARFCAKGARLLFEYAQNKRIPVKRLGKVIVAPTPSELPALEEIFQRAKVNGIQVEKISLSRLKEIEPEAKTTEFAIHSPLTAVIDSQAVLEALREDLLSAGVAIELSSPALEVTPSWVQTSNRRIFFHHLINAAGLHADQIAHQMGVARHCRILPFKGIYKKIRPSFGSRIQGSIYPSPRLNMPFLGVHLTKSVHGDVYAGPTAIPAFGRENYEPLKGLSFKETPFLLKDLGWMFLKNQNSFRALVREEFFRYTPKGFLEAVQELTPRLRASDLSAEGKVGIRAQLVDERKMELVMDFMIEKGPQSTHVLNAISPAFTSSFPFADAVLERFTGGASEFSLSSRKSADQNSATRS